jgi:hypothetical protein
LTTKNKKNRTTCVQQVSRFYNTAIDYSIILPVQVPALLLPVLPVPPVPPVPPVLPQVPQVPQVLQPRGLLPAWVLLCCSLLLPETEKPRKAR